MSELTIGLRLLTGEGRETVTNGVGTQELMNVFDSLDVQHTGLLNLDQLFAFFTLLLSTIYTVNSTLQQLETRQLQQFILMSSEKSVQQVSRELNLMKQKE